MEPGCYRYAHTVSVDEPPEDDGLYLIPQLQLVEIEDFCAWASAQRPA